MLDGENPAVRKMLNEILDDVRKKTGMKLNNEKLFIEAFMCPDTSCVIYISVIENLKVRKKSSVYGFLTLEYKNQPWNFPRFQPYNKRQFPLLSERNLQAHS